MQYEYMYEVHEGRNFQRRVQWSVHSRSRNEITLKSCETITHPQFRGNIRPFFASEVLNHGKSLVSEPNCTQHSAGKTTISVRQAAYVSISLNSKFRDYFLNPRPIFTNTEAPYKPEISILKL